MNGTPFEKFIALVEVDQQINALNTIIASLEKQNADNKRIEESHHSILEKVKNKLHDFRKEVELKELEMKTLDQQESDKKKRLETVANHKEYQSIKIEIDQLKKEQHALEDGLMAAWNQLETVKKEYENALKEYEQQQKIVHEQIEENNKKTADLKGQIDNLIKDRVEKEFVVPAEWLEKYAIMRAKVADPVVPVVEGSCSACFYKVSAQDMQFLKRRKLVQCKDCYRLLYLPEAHQSDVSENQDQV